MAKFHASIGAAGIFNIVRLEYTKKINDLSTFKLSTDGVGTTQRAAMTTGATISIYKDGTLDLKGTVRNVRFYEGGGVVLTGYCTLEIMARDEYSTSSVYKTASATSTTIFNALMGESTQWSAGSITASAASMDFRTNDTQSVWNALRRLLDQTGYEIVPNYTADTIGLVAATGTASQFTFQEGFDISNISFEKKDTAVTKVEVYGKGDGDTQITGEAGSGTPVKKVWDGNIITTAQANLRAAAELAIYTNGEDYYTFNVINPDLNFDLGDTGTILAPSANIASAVTVAIVAIARGIKNNTEFLEIQVTNSGLRKVQKTKNIVIAETRMNQTVNDTSMQGTSDILTYDNIRNANNATPLIIKCPIPEALCFDEAGNRRIISMLLDYDVDPFQSGLGSVTQSNVAPAVSGDTDDNETYLVVDTDTDTDNTGETLTHTSTTTSFPVTLGTFTPSSHGKFMLIYVHYKLYSQSIPTGTGEVYLRVNDGTYYYPLNTGARIFRGRTEVPLNDGDTSSDSHNHNPNAGTYFMTSDGGGSWTGITTLTDSDSHDHSVTGNTTLEPQGTITFVCPGDPYNTRYDVDARFYQGSGNTIGIYTEIKFAVDGRHDHDAGSDLDAASHNHSVSIGDDVSDADSINATEVNLYLDYFENKTITNNETAGTGVTVEMSDTGRIANGDYVYFNSATPAQNEWCLVSGHRILTTGKTLDTDVDITDSSTYPDTFGSWRVRILTDSANGDLLQGVAKVKHQMDN